MMGSNINGQNTNGQNGIGHNCDALLNKVLIVAEEDMRDLIEKDPEWKIRRINDIIAAKEEFEEFCAPNYDKDIRSSLTSRFDFSLLKLANAVRKDGNVYDPNVQNFVSRYSENEFKAIETLELFTGIDALDPKLIKEAMERKEGKIYQIIKEWYNKQMYEFNNLVDASPQNLMRNTIKRSLMQKYDSRFETIKKGILEYISKDPVAPAKLFNEYDTVLNRTYEAQLEWDKIMKEFGEVNINEIIRKNEKLQSLESEIREKISRIESDYLQNSDTSSLIKQEEELFTTLYNEYSSLQNEINAKMDDISKILDKANNMLRSMDLRSQSEQDPKIKIIYDAQREYVRNIANNMEESKDQLAYIEQRLSGTKLQLEARKEDIRSLIENPQNTTTIRMDEAIIEGINLAGRFQKRISEEVPFKLIDQSNKAEIKISAKLQLDEYMFTLKLGQGTNLYADIIGYDFSKKRFFHPGTPLRVVIGYSYIIHKNFRLSKDGIDIMDNQPLTLSEFLVLLGNIADNFDIKSRTVYLLLASPTGYDARIINYLQGNRKIYTMDLFLYLVDLKTGKLYTNRLIEDDVVSRIFKSEIDGESEAYYSGVVDRYLTKYESISLDRIAKEENLDSKILERVVDRMKSEKKLNLVKIDGVPAVKRR